MVIKDSRLNEPEFVAHLQKILDVKVRKNRYHPDTARHHMYAALNYDALSALPADKPLADGNANIKEPVIDAFDSMEMAELATEVFQRKGWIKHSEDLIFEESVIYPSYGYMGWHTHSDQPGIRIDCSFAQAGSMSGLFTLDNGKIIDSIDTKGWNFRLFYCGNTNNPFWHAVFSECDRYSIGFRIAENG